VTACQQRDDPFHNHDAGTVAFRSMTANPHRHQSCSFPNGAMAIVVLGERPQLFHIIGFALVLTGVPVAPRKPANLH